MFSEPLRFCAYGGEAWQATKHKSAKNYKGSFPSWSLGSLGTRIINAGMSALWYMGVRVTNTDQERVNRLIVFLKTELSNKPTLFPLCSSFSTV